MCVSGGEGEKGEVGGKVSGLDPVASVLPLGKLHETRDPTGPRFS